MGQQNRTEHERSRIAWGWVGETERVGRVEDKKRERAKEEKESRNSRIKRRMSNCRKGSQELEKFRVREEVRRARML